MSLCSTAKTPHVLKGCKHHVIIPSTFRERGRFRWLSLSLRITITYLLWQTMCLIFSDLQLNETILMGQTSCPYWESSFTSDSLLMNQLGGGGGRDSGESVFNDYPLLHQPANLSHAIPKYDNCPIHSQCRLNTLVSHNISYCQSCLLHRTLHRMMAS